MTKQDLLNITGLTEKQFYKRYPTQDHFFADYPHMAGGGVPHPEDYPDEISYNQAMAARSGYQPAMIERQPLVVPSPAANFRSMPDNISTNLGIPKSLKQADNKYSIVDTLAANNLPTDLAYRKAKAAEYGIQGYTGKDYENIMLAGRLTGDADMIAQAERMRKAPATPKSLPNGRGTRSAPSGNQVGTMSGPSLPSTPVMGPQSFADYLQDPNRLSPEAQQLQALMAQKQGTYSTAPQEVSFWKDPRTGEVVRSNTHNGVAIPRRDPNNFDDSYMLNMIDRDRAAGKGVVGNTENQQAFDKGVIGMAKELPLWIGAEVPVLKMINNSSKFPNLAKLISSRSGKYLDEVARVLQEAATNEKLHVVEEAAKQASKVDPLMKNPETLKKIFEASNKQLPSVRKMLSQAKYDKAELAKLVKSDKSVAKLLNDARAEEEVIMSGVNATRKTSNTARAVKNANDLYEHAYEMGGYVPDYAQMAYGGHYNNGGHTFSGNAWYGKGGNVMDVTPEQAEELRRQGYQFEILD